MAATPENFIGTRGGSRRIGDAAPRIKISRVLHPFADVTCRVIKSPSVRKFLADDMCSAARVGGIPRIVL